MMEPSKSNSGPDVIEMKPEVAEEVHPLPPNVFVVSHSNIMQCAVALFELSGKADLTDESKFDFNFGQNMWTMEVQVDQTGIRLKDLHNGALKPKENSAHGGFDEPYPDTYVTDSKCANDSTAAGAYTGYNAVGRANRAISGAVSGLLKRNGGGPMEDAWNSVKNFVSPKAPVPNPNITLEGEKYIMLDKFKGIKRRFFYYSYFLFKFSLVFLGVEVIFFPFLSMCLLLKI